jgi:hypothetical protein
MWATERQGHAHCGRLWELQLAVEAGEPARWARRPTKQALMRKPTWWACRPTRQASASEPTRWARRLTKRAQLWTAKSACRLTRATEEEAWSAHRQTE